MDIKDRIFLQWIVIFSMVADHLVSTIFISEYSYTISQSVGRLAMPIILGLFAISWRSTSSKEMYVLRLIALAYISQIPYMLAFAEFDILNVPFWHWRWNAIYTLSIVAIVMYSYDIINKGDIRGYLGLAIAFILGMFSEYEYGGQAIAVAMMFILIDKTNLFIQIPISLVIAFLLSIKGYINDISLTFMSVWVGTFLVIIAMERIENEGVVNSKFKIKGIKMPRKLWLSFYPLHFMLIYLGLCAIK